MVQVFVLLLLLEVSLHCLLAAPAVYAGAFFIMPCPTFDMVPWNFLEIFGGGGRDFGKFDLRVRNSVYVGMPWRPQYGVVGDGWGQRYAKNASPQRADTGSK